MTNKNQTNMVKHCSNSRHYLRCHSEWQPSIYDRRFMRKNVLMFNFIWCFQQIVVPLRGKEQNTVGNHSTNSTGSASMQYTEKGNVLYRFEHLTQEQLNTYRVDVYGYLMWFFVLSVSILDEEYGWCCAVFAVSFPFNKNTAVVYCPRRGISEPFLWH